MPVIFNLVTRTSRRSAQEPSFHKAAENLYRLESSGGYYALVKRAGKQFRRSLKTNDRKLAERRLGDLRTKIGALRISDHADLKFGQVFKQEFADRHALMDELVERIPAATLSEVLARIPSRKEARKNPASAG